jgi:hypothetical protein
MRTAEKQMLRGNDMKPRTALRTLLAAALALVAPAVHAATGAITVSSPSNNEGNTGGSTTFSFSVALDTNPTGSVTVTCSTTDGSATTADSDYTAESGSLTFTNTSAQSFTVSVTRDTKHETSETFTVGCSQTAGPDDTFTADSGTGTITNDDSQPTLSISDVTASEGDSGTQDYTFVVTKSNDSYQQITVFWSTSDGTATLADNDYGCPNGSACSGTLTFPSGTMTQNITVQVGGDTKSENDEAFSVTLGTPTNATNSDGSASGTINDNNDPVPQLTIAGDVSVNEGNSGTTGAVYTVNLSAASGRTITVKFSTANGSGTGGAAAPGDFTAITNQTVTFNPDVTSQQVTVNVNGDTGIELDETYSVSLSNPTNSSLAPLGTTRTGTIVNDDYPVITITGPAAANEGGTGVARIADFTVSLSAAAAADVSVSYQTLDGTATVSDGDYSNTNSVTNGPLTIPAGNTSGVIGVIVFGDARKEADETFSVQLSGSVNGVLSGQSQPGVGTLSASTTLLNDDAPSVVTIGDVLVGSEGAASTTQIVNFAVTLAPASGVPVTLTYQTVDGVSDGATAGSDYVAISPSTLTFNPGETSKNIAVTVNGDGTIEPVENFSVTLALDAACNAVPGGCATLGNAAGLGLIVDDDALPVVGFNAIPENSVAEGNGPADATMSFQVRLSFVSANQVTVNFATDTAGTATSGTDFTATSGTLTIPAGQQSVNFNVAIKGDTDDEAAETVGVVLSSPTGATLGTSTALGTIQNDDGPPIVTINDVSFGEGNAGESPSGRFTVQLSHPLGVAVEVNYATADGTAIAVGLPQSPADYMAQTGTLTFPAGIVSRQITIQSVGDTTNEVNETFFVNLTLPGGSPATFTGGDSQGLGTIENEDPLPTVSVSGVTSPEANLVSGAPELTVYSFPIQLSAASGVTVTVQFETVDGSATTADSDYVSNSATLTFLPGETEKTALVTVLGDVRNEIDEAFTLRLLLPTGALLGASEAAGTITNDDSLPVLSLVGQTAAEAAGKVTFDVTLAPESGQQVTVKYTSRSLSASIADNDYVATTGTLTFLPGETTKSVDVTVTDDPRNELDETLGLKLSDAVNALVPDPAPVNELQNTSFEDGAGSAFTGWTVDAVGGGTVAAVTLPPDASSTVQSGLRAVRLQGGASGTASVSQDVVVLAGETFVFTGYMQGDGTSFARARVQSLATSKYWTGSTWSAVPTDAASEDSATYVQRTITLVAEDAATVGAPTVSLRLILYSDQAGPAYVDDWQGYSSSFPDPSEAKSVIQNDDAVPTLSIDDAVATEKGPGTSTSQLLFTVTLSEASGLLISVPFTTSDGTATLADNDYAAPPPATLVFTPGTTAQTVTVTLNDDAKNEADEAFSVVLGTPTNAGLLKQTGVGTIVNDDAAPTLAIADGFVTEGNSGQASLNFVVSLSAVSGQNVSVNYTTADGTALASDSDFASATGTLAFAAGETSKTVAVAVNGDTKFEADETFKLDLVAGSAVNATILDGQASGSILNDDTAPVVTVGDVTLTEGNAGSAVAVFPVALSNATSQGVTVNFSTADASASAADGDYVPLTGTLVFNPGVTAGEIRITVNADTKSEGDETLLVNLGAATNAGVGDSQGVATIVDDDPLPTLSIGNASVVEGDSGSKKATFTVTLDAAAGRPVTVSYATADGTATAGKDYTAGSGALTIAGGALTQTIEVTLLGDTANESDETFTLTLSSPGAATLATASGTGTITDDDGPLNDFNGDGFSDVLFRDAGGAPYVWLLNGTTLLSSGATPTISTDWVLQFVGDFNGDGKSDLLWREKASSNLFIWYQNGPTQAGGGFTAAQADANWEVQAVGDFNGDGRQDLIWRHVGAGSTNGALFIWLMDGTNLVGATYLQPISTDWQIQSTGDFNGDGKSDVLWREKQTGNTYIWMMDGPTVIGGTGYTASLADNKWEIHLLGDFNGDGKADILWRNTGGPDTGALFVWLMDGANLAGATYLQPISTDWQVQGSGDYNGDGRGDILWRESTTGNTYIWIMDGATVIGGTGYTSTQADPTWRIQHRR